MIVNEKQMKDLSTEEQLDLLWKHYNSVYIMQWDGNMPGKWLTARRAEALAPTAIYKVAEENKD